MDLLQLVLKEFSAAVINSVLYWDCINKAKKSMVHTVKIFTFKQDEGTFPLKDIDSIVVIDIVMLWYPVTSSLTVS